VKPGLRPSLIYQLARLFRNERIDVVHTHNTKPLLYAGPAARLAGVGGVIHTRHGQRHGATRRQNLLFSLAARCADRMVCVSDDSARRCGDEGVDPDKTTTLYNGIDTTRFAFSGPDSSGPALYVGRLSPEKDLPTLLRAAAIVVTKRPSFRLRIAGAGVSLPELVALSAKLGLPNAVEFVGEVRDIPSLLRGASMFVLSSLTEGVPLTVLEAMACGLPVVATRVGGTGEAVAEGATGLLVDPGRPQQLADALMQVFDDPERARQMGAAGRTRAEALFDVRTMVRRYQSLYADVLDRRQALAA
jgi:glycosyltransferase involved in cell wall biosynthesis